MCFSYTILLTRPRRGDGIDHTTAVAVLFYITHMSLAGAHIIYSSLVVVVVVERLSHHWGSLDETFSSRRDPDGQGPAVHLWRFSYSFLFPAELALFISPPIYVRTAVISIPSTCIVYYYSLLHISMRIRMPSYCFFLILV